MIEEEAKIIWKKFNEKKPNACKNTTGDTYDPKSTYMSQLERDRKKKEC